MTTFNRLAIAGVATALLGLSGCIIAPDHGPGHDRYGDRHEDGRDHDGHDRDDRDHDGRDHHDGDRCDEHRDGDCRDR